LAGVLMILIFQHALLSLLEAAQIAPNYISYVIDHDIAFVAARE
jgi:hypothetical protein